jgi:hypothetical protein
MRQLPTEDASEHDRIDPKARTSQVLPLGSRTTQSGLDPFDEEAPFQLRDGRDDREHRLAEWGASVDLFTNRDELDPKVPEQFQRLDQVPNGPAEAIEGGYDDHIHTSGLHDCHQLVECQASVCHPRDPFIDVFRDVIPASGSAVLPQVAQLIVARLVARADPNVDRHSLHRTAVAT